MGSVSRRSIPQKKTLDGVEWGFGDHETRERMIVLMASTCLQNDCQKQAMWKWQWHWAGRRRWEWKWKWKGAGSCRWS